MGPEDRKALLVEMAEKARHDLHFFCVVVQGVTCMSPSSGIHGRVCSFLGDRTVQRKWLEMFRTSLKTTVGTVGTSLQDVARDPQEHILIVSAVQPLTESFLWDIKRVVSGKVWRLLYPELRPDRKMWSKDEAAIQGREQREATWKAASIKTGVTGGHFTKIKWDDLVIPDNVATRSEAGRIIKKFRSLAPVRDNWQTPELICGTPYTEYDLYAWLKRAFPGKYRRLVIPVCDVHGVPAWPEEAPAEAIADLKTDPEVFYPQYMLDPRPPALQYFKAEHFRYFRLPEEPEEWVGEEFVGFARPVVKPLDEMSLYLGWDPATGVEGGDEAAFAVVGTDTFGNFYVVEVVHGNMTLAEQIDEFFVLHERYPIMRTACEMAGPFAALEGTLSAEMGRRGKWHHVEKAQLRNQQKTQRVKLVLGPKYQNKRVYHRQGMAFGEEEDQLTKFPGARHDDIADAISHGVDIAQTYAAYGEVPEAKVIVAARSGFGLYPGMGYTREQLCQVNDDGGDLRRLRRAVGSVGIFG